ncbi:hypothetical protein HN789_05550 [archaeon]|jgi:hypothetical protein|nr:hypothetical protein [archaeon]MBT4022978.1 hypothetical protein [archaeon]MBT4271969.1 hypothetical protein [archaeon]MBT4461807.1 hypothetical protein [archaeon]MBT4858178.1 hypothetical protein [archaeon]
MIHSMSNRIKQRKSKLNNYLTNNKEDLKPEKHHQIIGALNEMDHILSILENHREKEIHKENNPDDVFLFKPISKKNLSVLDMIKGLF